MFPPSFSTLTAVCCTCWQTELDSGRIKHSKSTERLNSENVYSDGVGEDLPSADESASRIGRRAKTDDNLHVSPHVDMFSVSWPPKSFIH